MPAVKFVARCGAALLLLARLFACSSPATAPIARSSKRSSKTRCATSSSTAASPSSRRRDQSAKKNTPSIRSPEMGGDIWIFQARIQYGEHDVTLPVPVQVAVGRRHAHGLAHRYVDPRAGHLHRARAVLSQLLRRLLAARRRSGNQFGRISTRRKRPGGQRRSAGIAEPAQAATRTKPLQNPRRRRTAAGSKRLQNNPPLTRVE